MPRNEPIKAVRGVRDILPEARGLWRVAEKAAARVAHSFGYREIVTPLIEHRELIERLGEETDAVAKELYGFEDRGGRQLALRPEATAGVVRAYFEGGLNQGPQPARLYLMGPMFRYDRPQKGRYRQFFQFNVEAIGASSPALDAEVIELARTWLFEVGLTDITLDLNSIGDDKCRPAYLELLRDYYRPLKSRLHGDCQKRLEVNPLRLLDCKVPQDQPFKAGAPKITDHLCEECQAAWAMVQRLLEEAGIEYRLNPYLVRGLDYYTRTVFEFYPSTSSGQQDTVVAGGRYDGLAHAEGWPSTPGVGFAGGLDRVTELMAEAGEEVIVEPAAEVVVLPDAELIAEAAEVARIARKVRTVAVDYEPRSLRAKMRAADRLGARWAVLLNAGDAERRVVQLRDMASGEQVEVTWPELPGAAGVSGFTAPHCGSLRVSDAGKDVELYGWVARRRDHGGLIFIDLRDRWGAVQVVFNPTSAPAAHAQASELRSEYVVRVKGTVATRRAGAENPKMATGDVEVAATEMEVVNRSETTPFPIEDPEEPDEKTRLEFRYLDLRRPRMTRMLELRSRVNSIIRAFMESNEFVEVETPILTRSSPSGARDFLVPSRLHPGDFYALPQAPQMLKQLLMVSGVQRYYQIARCFRDENLRADRQPEFTQLDVELSFCDEEDVFSLMEGLFHKLWHDIVGVDLPLPFPRLDIKESLLRYGSDKPDVRYELEIADLGHLLTETRAEIFRGALTAGGVVRGLSVPGGRALARRELDELVTVAKGAGGRGLAWLPGGPLDKFLSEKEIADIQLATGAGPDDLVLIAADRRRKAETVMGRIRSEVARRRKLIRTDEWKFVWINPTYLFEEDDQGKLTYAHHPFTRPFEADMSFVDERPYDVRAHAYDIVCNGYELGGGSLRIYDAGMQERVFGLLGMPLETIRARFGTLLQAFGYGVPPHGGIAPGIDRIVMMLGRTDNIRDVIAFPKTQSMSDLMLGAPSEVDPEQLEELHIQVKPPAKPAS